MATIAKIQASIAGGGNVQGGLVASFGQTVALTATNTTGFSSAYWEIYDYPIGFSAPSGWLTDANGVIYYAPTNPTSPPPVFTLPASGGNNWGKFAFRLRINQNALARNQDTTPNVAFNPAFTDESTMIDILSPVLGMPGVAFNESTQYDTLRQWIGGLMASLRKCDFNAGGGTVTLLGDVTGASNANTVVKINGSSVPAGGALTTGNGLYVTGAAALAYAALNLAGGAGFVSGVLPVGNLPSLAGDVTGAITSNTVAKINGATVPAAGALTTGNSLHVTGTSALGYAALNLAGGAGWVTGALPLANITPGTAGQVFVTNAGATAPAWVSLTVDTTITAAGVVNVVSLTGSAGVVSMIGSTHTWVVGATPVLNQTANSGAGTTGAAFTIQAQASTGTGTIAGGSLNLLGGLANTATGTGGAVFITGGGGATTATSGGVTISSGQATVTNGFIKLVTGNVAAGIQLSISALSTDFLGLGALNNASGFAQSGLLRMPNASTILVARDSTHLVDIALLRVDGTNNFNIGDGNNAAINMFSGGNVVLQPTANVHLSAGSTFFRDASVGGVSVTMVSASTGASSFTVANTVTSYAFSQAVASGASATGASWSMSAQGVSGTGTTTSGSLSFFAGPITGTPTNANAGSVSFTLPVPVGAGTYGNFNFDTGGGIVTIQKLAALTGTKIYAQSGTYLQIGDSAVGSLLLAGGNNRLDVTSSGLAFNFAGVQGWLWDNTTTNQLMTLKPNTTSFVWSTTASTTASGGGSTFSAQSSSFAGGNGGLLTISGGNASGTGTTTSGGVTISSGTNTGSTTGNVGNINFTVPAVVGAGTRGTFLFNDSGALIAKLSSVGGSTGLLALGASGSVGLSSDTVTLALVGGTNVSVRPASNTETWNFVAGAMNSAASQNFSLGGVGTFGSGLGVMCLINANTIPTTNPSAGNVILFADDTGNLLSRRSLRTRSEGNIVTTLAAGCSTTTAAIKQHHREEKEFTFTGSTGIGVVWTSPTLTAGQSISIRIRSRISNIVNLANDSAFAEALIQYAFGGTTNVQIVATGGLAGSVAISYALTATAATNVVTVTGTAGKAFNYTSWSTIDYDIYSIT